jgi:hypothetical protein
MACFFQRPYYLNFDDAYDVCTQYNVCNELSSVGSTNESPVHVRSVVLKAAYGCYLCPESGCEGDGKPFEKDLPNVRRLFALSYKCYGPDGPRCTCTVMCRFKFQRPSKFNISARLLEPNKFNHSIF